jgi:hypothetical protein
LILHLANPRDAYRFYVDQKLVWPPTSRWERFVRWLRRVFRRPQRGEMTVVAVDIERGLITVETVLR